MRFFRNKWVIIGIVTVAIIGGIYWYYSARNKTSYQFVTVLKGPIIETVSVTGNTTPIRSVSLGFQNSGTIAHVYRAIGDSVSAGTVIAELNTDALSASLKQAEAAYNSAVASRSSMSQGEIDTAARNVYLSAYTTLDTTLHNDIDTFFGGPTSYGPELLNSAPMYRYGDVSRLRQTLDTEMETYRRALPNANASDPATLLVSANKVAARVSELLAMLAVIANDNRSVPTDAQLTALATARAAVDNLLSGLSTARDAYRSGSAGATSLANASVEQAAAGVAVAKANLQGTQITAPISGVLTLVDAKEGQIATPGASLVTIISASSYEVDAGIPETDIGKVRVGNAVTMTLDAFPGESFAGTVFYIDPAQTVDQGGVDYKIKVSFATLDARMKSGLTANLTIQTRKKDNVLTLPQYAILQNDAGTFVKILKDTKTVDVPVTLGLQDDKGNVEIISGVTEGEQVLNIGLKQ